MSCQKSEPKPAELLAELGVKPGRYTTDLALIALAKEVRALKTRVHELENPKRSRAKRFVDRVVEAVR
ncbi:MAG TPA: hypothetical protein VGE08_17520 [Steroidobacter sp.]|uniref:hypothetical protein n=1 Tax=Steroidobacter sp. TaxID=1978227 RepID=UPI002ED82B3D